MFHDFLPGVAFTVLALWSMLFLLLWAGFLKDGGKTKDSMQNSPGIRFFKLHGPIEHLINRKVGKLTAAVMRRT
jgi:hypothetical protein